MKTPLMLSCTKSNLDVVRMLVDHGASTRLVNKDGWNGFHIACREGHSEIVSFLLEQDEDLWKSVSKNGRTPLHTAALHGCADVVRLLLTRCRFDIDVADSCGNTPLMDAARGGHISVLRILVEHGARIDAEDKLGRRCLHIAAESGRQAALSCLIQEYNVDINTPSRVGQTALHYAAKEGHAALVSHLMRNGSDVEKIDRNHRAALHLASGGQHSECVELILLQSTVDKPDINGSTARSLARNSQVISVFDTFS
ncbi:ankyrin repeat domain-containing protein 16-like isoform X2 [Tubulanus polymorphus]|uniref:ankyrin repeat domain-containing protein 16-like isoform X2 n=1 Tax=Tubulanus polymorphus TaxID=672921 RepID=UPI003DA38A30